MIRKTFFVLLCGIITATVLAPEPRLSAKFDRTKADLWVDSVFNAMSDDERIGQLFMVAVFPHDDAATTNQLSNYINNIHIGGVLFRQGDPVTQAKITNRIQQESAVPLFIALDGEWGLSMRLTGTTRFPKNMMLGAVGDLRLIEDYAREVGRQCREMGIQINFAPVLDVNNNPDNPVIGTRSFGENPDDVAERGIAYARGLESMDVIAVAKHFPGHGGTSEDSHQTLPTVHHNAAELDSIELAPFRRYIAEGFAGVMTGHLYVPALDSVTERATSLSPVMIEGVLKKRLGFEGLCFTDALEMKGATGKAGGSPAVLSILAGNDVVLAPASPEKEYEAVCEAVKNNVITKDAINEKCRKILKYKYITGLNAYQPIELTGLKERLNTPYADRLTAQLNAQAITVLKNEDSYLPLKQLDKTKIAALTIGEPADNDFVKMLERYCPVTSFKITHKMKQSDTDNVINALKTYDAVVCGVFTSSFPEPARLRELAEKCNLVCVFFTAPYFLKRYEQSVKPAKSIIMAYEPTPYSQSYAAQAVFGGIAANGKMSVSVPGLFDAGTGLSLPKTRLGYAPAEATGINTGDLDSIAIIANEGIKEGAYPGCQVLVAKDGMVIYSRSFGNYDYNSRKPVTESSVYDLASVSKATGTLLAVMKTYDEHRLALDSAISVYMPELRNTDKNTLTVKELLYHQSGLSPTITDLYKTIIDTGSYEGNIFNRRKTASHPVAVDRNVYARNDFKFRPEIVSTKKTDDYPIQVARNFYLHRSYPDTLLNEIIRSELKRRGSYVYSDINFILLKMIVERQMSRPMDTLLRADFFDRLGAYHTTYRPLDRLDSSLIVPTEYDGFMRRQTLRGYVHDESAAVQGGVSGNAGLFSNANDLAKALQLYLNDGEYGGERYLTEETCRLFTRTKNESSRRGLGFDKPETDPKKASPCGELASPSVYGHTGYTGTCFWIDPDNKLIYIFLSNRVNPTRINSKLSDMNIRTRIQDVIYRAAANSTNNLTPNNRSGSDLN